jgi:hypothetical protein
VIDPWLGIEWVETTIDEVTMPACGKVVDKQQCP